MPLSENGERLRTRRRRTREEAAETTVSPTLEPVEKPVMPKFNLKFGSVHDQCQHQYEDGKFCALRRRDVDNPHSLCERHEWLALHPDYREDD